MRFGTWLVSILFVFGPFFRLQAGETDFFRECVDCSVTELDSFFNETKTPYESFKLLHSQGSKGPAVLFHGLGDSPYYMKDIAELYFRNGYDVYSTLVEGHGNTPEQLNSIHYAKWNAQAEAIISDLNARYQDQVLVAGFSNGGLISTVATLNSNVKSKIKSLLLLSPAFGLKPSVQIKFKIFQGFERLVQFLNVSVLNSYLEKLLTLKVRTNLCENCKGPVRYNYIPLNAPAQLLKNAAVLKRASTIEIPTVMVLTSDDKTISLNSALSTFRKLFSGEKNLIWIQGNDPKTAVIPKNIPADQMTVIHSAEIISHVLQLRTQGLARPEEANMKVFDGVAAKVESLLLKKASSMCVSFYMQL